jgi:SPP1 family predicted phage head-tail adaptor
MDSSKFDRLLTLQIESITRSDSGQENVTWSELPPIWAQYIPQTTGKEYYAASQIVGELDAIFRIRYRPGIKQNMRLVFGSDTYDIQDIREVERKEGLDLLCKLIRVPR